MRSKLSLPRRHHRLQAVAAAAAVLLGGALPAQAQTPPPYYILVDSVAFSPDLPAPFDPAVAVQNLTGYQLQVGYAAAGSFSALAGAQLTVDYVGLGSAQNGSGSFTITGPNARVDVIGNAFSRMEIGGTGSATLIVQNVGLLDAASAACTNSCYTGIGNDAGGTGTLNVNGIGSEARFRFLGVGQASAFTTGATTHAYVNVLGGGTLRTEGATVASMNSAPNGDGSEKSIATVVINGAGSQWIVGRNSINNTAALMGIGSGAGADGLVTISGGGKLHIDGTGSSGPNDGINIGSSGKGKLTVTGTGSQLLTTGVNHFINVGANNSLGDGTFEIRSGGAASTLYLNVGRNGGTGTMLIDGAGSTLTQSGVGVNQTPGANGPAFASIGLNGGNGSVTVSDGGQWLISDGGGDGRTAQGSPGFILGNGANSSGSLTITGIGSKLEVVSNTINPGAGTGDNYNAFVALGYGSNTASGTLTVSGGGKLLITGQAASTVAARRGTDLNIGGSSDTAAGGTGPSNIIGPGSELRMTGSDPFLAVGRNGTGLLSLAGSAHLESMIVNIGRGTTATSVGNGTLLMNNSTMALNGQQTGSVEQFGAGLTIGNRGGTGQATLANNSVITITNLGSSGAGLNLGGTSASPTGNGTLLMTGGSQINIVTAPGLAGATIGRDGTGLATLQGSSRIDIGTGTLHVGRLSAGTGTVNIQSGSKVLAGVAHIGGSIDSAGGGNGTVVVTGGGSELQAVANNGFIGVGRGGGTGSLSVTSGGSVSSTSMSVGRSGGTGTLNVQNASLGLTGQQSVTGGLGANLSIGVGGSNGAGTGIANLTGSMIAITNNSLLNADGNGAAMADLNLGGRSDLAGGTGTLNMLSSHITVGAANGVASATIGRTGTGIATLQGSSITVNGSSAANGSVYVARETGSTGVLTLNGGSSVNAGFVGVGVSEAGTGKALNPAGGGGTGTLVLNDGSTINAPRFELGAGGLLAGNGTINAGQTGEVVIAGTISPGTSPGRIRIYCDVTMLATSQLILEIDGNGVQLDNIDQLIIGNDSTFDLTQMQIVFAFVGDTNPEDVVLDLTNHLRSAEEGSVDGDPTQSLAGEDELWTEIIDPENFVFRSSVYDVTSFTFDPASGRIGNVQASEIPEPATYALVLLALGLMMRGRRRVPLVRH